jgi:hypothetical protein
VAVTGWKNATGSTVGVGWLVADIAALPDPAADSRHLWVDGERVPHTEVPGATGPRRPPIWGNSAWEIEHHDAITWTQVSPHPTLLRLASTPALPYLAVVAKGGAGC